MKLAIRTYILAHVYMHVVVCGIKIISKFIRQTASGDGILRSEQEGKVVDISVIAIELIVK